MRPRWYVINSYAGYENSIENPLLLEDKRCKEELKEILSSVKKRIENIPEEIKVSKKSVENLKEELSEFFKRKMIYDIDPGGEEAGIEEVCLEEAQERYKTDCIKVGSVVDAGVAIGSENALKDNSGFVVKDSAIKEGIAVANPDAEKPLHCFESKDKEEIERLKNRIDDLECFLFGREK